MSDSATLLAYLNENAQPDGSFTENLNITAATLGWLPDQVSENLQELVSGGKVEALHEGGDPKRIAGSSWRVVGYAPPVGDGGLDGMTVKELRAYAEARGIDLEDATKKDDVRAAIDLALEEREA